MNEFKSKWITLKSLISKEVINVTTGERLGHINDADIETETGCIKNFYVPLPCKNPFSKKNEVIKFAYTDIQKIGNDAILIKNCYISHRHKEKKEKICCK